MQQELVHQTEDRRIRADAKRHYDNGERGKAWTSAEVTAGVPEIAQQVIDVVHSSHIAAFLLALLHSIHRSERRQTSFLRRESSRDFQLDALIHVKLEFLFEIPLYAIPL
jgi:hypothetical protein